MAYDMTTFSHAHQEGTSTFPPLSEALRSIRVGAVAQQPSPDLRDIIYVGLSGLVPADLQALCSCAGLFYARVLLADGDRYRLEVAALPHYFDAPARTRDRHVRTTVLSHDAFAHLLEHDRSIAGKATCDVRELVEEHIAAVTWSSQTKEELRTLAPTYTTPPEPQPADDDAHVQGDTDEEKENVDLDVLTQVFVPCGVIRETFDTMHITAARRERRVHSALLAAAMKMIDQQIERCHTLRECDQLEAIYKEMQAVRRWRRDRWNAGYGWQRVVTLTPVASGTGWDLVIGRPAA